MLEKEIRLLFERGVITSATIVEAVMSEGYWIHFKDKNSPLSPVILESQRGNSRIFRSLDSCFRTVKKIGLRNASIHASEKK